MVSPDIATYSSWTIQVKQYAATIVIAFACLASGQHPPNVSASPPQTSSPMDKMKATFTAAKRAKVDDLIGTWVAVEEVWTQNFLTGGIGPDQVKADENGLRRQDVPLQSTVARPQTMMSDRPIEWKLMFDRIDGGVRATSEVPWVPTGDSSDVKYEPSGDFTFSKDYGGDGAWVYRCRAASSTRIVCLIKTAEGHGVVFRKLTSSSGKP